MKKFFLLCALALVSFCACNDVQYKSKIHGTWLCQETDRGKLPTNDAFVLNFTHGTETHAGGFVQADNSSRWLESDNLTYTIKDGVLKVSGANVVGDSLDLSFTIKTLTRCELIYQENYFKVNGVDLADNETYTFSRVTDTYSARIIGTWEGRSITNDPDSDYTFKITFKADGAFDFYNKEDGQWVLVENNNGSYKLYGDFLANNYSGTSDGRDVYDCWLIEIQNDVMTCTGWRETEGSSELHASINQLRKVD